MDEKKVESIIFGLKETIAEQKEEIERLTEVMNDFRQEVITLNNEKLELQKQVDELKKNQMPLSPVVLTEKQYVDLISEKNELQKQVDELLEQRDVFKNLFENCNNSSITTEEIINAMNSFYREQAEHLAGLKIEQAVKDTVKEILDELENIKQYAKDFYGLNEKVGVDIAINTMKTVLQRKGVEVE